MKIVSVSQSVSPTANNHIRVIGRAPQCCSCLTYTLTIVVDDSEEALFGLCGYCGLFLSFP